MMVFSFFKYPLLIIDKSCGSVYLETHTVVTWVYSKIFCALIRSVFFALIGTMVIESDMQAS